MKIMEKESWSKRKKIIAVVSVIILTLAPISYLLVGSIVYGQIAASDPACGSHDENEPDKFWAHHYNGTRIESFASESYWFNGSQNVTIQVSDEDITLDAWWKKGEDGMPVVILIHGIRSCKRNHEVLIPASMLVDSGYSVLIPTLRDHGDSTRDDGRVDGGITEWKDVVASWNWVNSTHDIPKSEIGVYGGSAGAAIAAWAFHRENGIQAAFIDSSWYDFERLMKEELEFSGLPTFLGGAGVSYGRLFTGVDLTENPPSEAVANVGDRNIFILGNIPDNRIRIHHATDLWNSANASVSSEGFVDGWFSNVVLEEAVNDGPYDHLVTMVVEPDEYKNRLVTFFDTAFMIERS